METYQLIGNFFDLAAGSGRRNRHRHDNLVGPQSPRAFHGGLHGSAAGQTVIHQDHQLPFQILGWALAAISPLASIAMAAAPAT